LSSVAAWVKLKYLAAASNTRKVFNEWGRLE